METATREQDMEVIEFYLPTLTDRQIRLVKAFIKGLKKGAQYGNSIGYHGRWHDVGI